MWRERVSAFTSELCVAPLWNSKLARCLEESPSWSTRNGSDTTSGLPSLCGQKPYRLVVSRIKRRDGQTGLFTGDAFTYRAILTSDHKWDNQQIVSFYNQRGNAERTFDTMNNAFGWSKLPCSFLNENTAFMIITALYANIYQVMLATFASKLSWIKENFRLKKFIFRFITVAAKRIKTGRQHVLKLYTHKDYSRLLT